MFVLKSSALYLLLSGALFGFGSPLVAVEAPTDEAALNKAKLYAEVVLRLRDTDLNTDEKLKSKVEKALVANTGLPAYLDIVEAFGLKAYDNELIALAVAHPDDAIGAKALRVVLANKNIAALETALATTAGSALVRALGNANDQQAVGLLIPIVIDKNKDLLVRQDAVRALGKIELGARALLDLVTQGKIAELKSLAGGVLANAAWDGIRAEAAAIFPPPQSRDNKPLASNAELAKRSGDMANGERVFGTVCMICHAIHGKGIDYGPALSQRRFL